MVKKRIFPLWHDMPAIEPVIELDIGYWPIYTPACGVNNRELPVTIHAKDEDSGRAVRSARKRHTFLWPVGECEG